MIYRDEKYLKLLLTQSLGSTCFMSKSRQIFALIAVNRHMPVDQRVVLNLGLKVNIMV